eukprot:CAMPEP_0197627228 /NCGR_PEP_ID=MMETSP1338-20131121/5898_1 /TAXON_ID=43686 ORGANISM="Pelagodinium beii, Strain RCC1491" /NCGR_SAMPLE_ID=MMETSP1338 /ASSEMBLY_ACC=CAM_ASM_000754 /LENGTH=315 /DNA_ID=CAMNT_0043197893 /DNA_START=26 /DNA_END=970 /DNA_ORIENTATION=+
MDIQLGSIQKRTYHFRDAGKAMEYALFVPSGYKHDKETPLVVLLHPLFSNPHQVIRFPGITGEAERKGHIVVAPFGYNDRGWYGSLDFTKRMSYFPPPQPANLSELSEKDVLNVLALICQDFSIDKHRIYLMGASMGGAGTLHLASTYPDIWAAVAPMAPAIRQNSPTIFVDSAARRIPVMLVTGDRDNITPIQPARRWVADAREAGMDIHFVELPGSTHVWPACRPKVIAEIFDFLSHQRKVTAASLEGFSNSTASDQQLIADEELEPSHMSCRFRFLKDAIRIVYQRGSRGLIPAGLIVLSAVSFLEAELLAW